MSENKKNNLLETLKEIQRNSWFNKADKKTKIIFGTVCIVGFGIFFAMGLSDYQPIASDIPGNIPSEQTKTTPPESKKTPTILPLKFTTYEIKDVANGNLTAGTVKIPNGWHVTDVGVAGGNAYASTVMIASNNNKKAMGMTVETELLPNTTPEKIANLIIKNSFPNSYYKLTSSDIKIYKNNDNAMNQVKKYFEITGPAQVSNMSLTRANYTYKINTADGKKITALIMIPIYKGDCKYLIPAQYSILPPVRKMLRNLTLFAVEGDKVEGAFNNNEMELFLGSFKVNQNYLSYMAQKIAVNQRAAFQKLSNTLSQTSDIITSGYNERSARMDNMSDKVSEGIRGVNTYNGSSGIVEAPVDYEYVYQSSNDPTNVIGTNSTNHPGGNYVLLEKRN